jgi:tRNA pseudouridine55 synthase
MDGFLLIDKEKGMTSFDVIRVLKRRFNIKKLKIGHSGTLDPVATGLMIIAVGKATKILGKFLGADKTYVGTAKFGAVSDTYDSDGEITEMSDIAPISLDVIKKIVQENFTGKIKQMPPKFSAKKVNGVRAYDLAREGKEFILEAKEVKVYSFEISSFKWPYMEFSVKCSSGTYIRSLVHDLGQKLGVGAYMDSLRRTTIADYSVDDAIKADDASLKDITTSIRIP